jgi:hypothetical protein
MRPLIDTQPLRESISYAHCPHERYLVLSAVDELVMMDQLQHLQKTKSGHVAFLLVATACLAAIYKVCTRVMSRRY